MSRSPSAALGNFELNVFRPLTRIISRRVRLLTDGMVSFEDIACAASRRTRAHREQMERSLMLVTALTPHIGYDHAAEIAKRAHRDGSTLKQAASALGYVTEADSICGCRRRWAPKNNLRRYKISYKVIIANVAIARISRFCY
jgi:fumarate hydratase class II